MLPLRHDKPEAHIQHEFLADIVIQSPLLILTAEQNYFQVVSIFAHILDTKLCTAQMRPKVQQALLFLA